MTTPDRRLTSPITLAVAGVLVLIMAIWGVQAATKSIPADPSTAPTTETEPSCAPGEQETVVKFIGRDEVQVSVYNTGKRAGRAQDTMDLLEGAGFSAGAVGNDEQKVPRAEVRTTITDSPGAELVARALGKNTKVVVVDEDYGPGVDVFIGDKFRRLAKNAPEKIKLAEPKITCN